MAYKNKEDVIKYREKHREKHKLYMKEYYIINRDKLLLEKRKYHNTNSVQINKKKKKYYIKNKDNAKRWQLKKLYGLSLEEFNKMKLDSNGKCEICKLSKLLCVDHNHNTRKVRGLLCGNCNSLLGFVNDNIDTLDNAIRYLRKYE